MQKIFLLGIDRLDKNSPSSITEMRGTNLSQLPFIDLKIYYFETHLNELFSRDGKALLTEKELSNIIDNFCRFNPTVNKDEVTESFDFYELKPDGSYKYNININDFKFEKGYRYLVTNKDTYDYLKDMVHLGPRGEGFYDLTSMDYLITFDGYIFKFGYLEFEQVTQWLDKETYDKMLPHEEHIKKTLRNAKLSEIYSKRKDKTYYTLKFDKIVEQTQFEQFINAPDDELLQPYPTLKFHEIVRTNDRIEKCFDYFINKHKQATQENPYWMGLDYETNGFPFDDPEFYHMGVSIADIEGIAAYFDMEWMQSTGGNFEFFKTKYKEFLDECAEDCHTYNVGFEMRCTYLLYNKLYFFQESGAINKADGRVRKNFSLKYTAMLALHVPSWDDEFDDLTDQFDWLMWNGCDRNGDFVGTYNKDEVTNNVRYVYTKDTYKESEVWDYIKERYSQSIPEFERLIDAYWGYPFKCIPSDILGKYCCIDSFNTVCLRKKCEDTYPDKRVWSVFNNNLVYGALLNIHGFHLDLDYNCKLEKLSAGWTAYCKLQCIKLYLHIEMKAFNLDESKLEYPVKYLIEGYNLIDSRNLLNKFANDSDYGFDVNKFNNIFSVDLGNKVIEVFERYGEIFDYNSRLRKLYNELDKVISEYYGVKYNEDFSDIIGFDYNGKFIELPIEYDDLIAYSKFKSSYDEIVYVLNEIDPDNLEWEYNDIYGNKIDLDGISDWCSAIYNINSPKQLVPLKLKVFGYYFDTITKINMLFGAENMVTEFGPDKWDSPIEDKYKTKEVYDECVECDGTFKLYFDCKNYVDAHIDLIKGTKQYKRYMIDHNPMLCLYDSIWDYFYEVTGKDEDGNDTYGPIDGVDVIYRTIEDQCSPKDGGLSSFLSAQSTDYMREVDDLDSFAEKYKTLDICNNTVYGFSMWGFCYNAQAKYRKVLTTYIRGQFWKYNCNVNQDDDNLISTERWHEDDTGLVKCYSPFAVCQKQSKRWGAATHTIPSKSEVKRVMIAPKGYLFSYNDISGAEVRAISYYAKDKFMLDAYSKNIDPYIMMAKVLSPGHDEGWYKWQRPIYKQLFLGSLYGMGIELLASKIDKTPEEAQEVYDKMFTLIPQIKQMIIDKGNYCIEHNGECDSVLGDKLYMDAGEGMDRYARLGINQVIQSFAAIGLADGFEHMIYDSYKYNELKIRPVNVVHDSTQNYVETKKLFELLPFFNKEITKYLYDKYGIEYEFDLEVGANYFDQCVIESAGEGKVTLEGDFVSLVKLLTKLTTEELDYSIISIQKKGEELMLNADSIPEAFKPKIVRNLVKSFYARQGGMASYEMDYSKYKITIENKPGLKLTAYEDNNGNWIINGGVK